MTDAGPRPAGSHGCFRHEAWFYDGDDEFAAGATAFVREGLEADESVLVVVRADKIDRLRSELNGHDVSRVLFADMAELGANPARLIPTWTRFVERRPPGRSPLRGIGEPIWPRRTPAELVESHRHEELLNLAFADTPDFWLRCPYDVGALDPAVIDRARRTHPLLRDQDGPRVSVDYAGIDAASNLSSEPLPPPAASRRELDVGLDDAVGPASLRGRLRRAGGLRRGPHRGVRARPERTGVEQHHARRGPRNARRVGRRRRPHGRGT